MDTEIYSEFVKRLMKPGKEIQKEMTPKKLELEHMANLLGSESGEILTYVKRHVFYGQELDMPAIKKELGDVMFAFTAICNILGLEVHDIRELNQQKLTARYPLGLYSNEQAKARADENEDPNAINWNTLAPGSMITNGRVVLRFSKMISPDEFEAVSNDEVVVITSIYCNWKFKYINSSVS